jgi:branched-chain amino acid transport system ATP-binding protein
LLARPAGLLSHGEKRQLEIAMCLATAPQVLLLDEPLAGMGAEETERMLGLLVTARGHAILLVEHDMDAGPPPTITVMVNGVMLRHAQVRNAQVQAAYSEDIEMARPDPPGPRHPRLAARATSGTGHLTSRAKRWLVGANGMGRAP